MKMKRYKMRSYIKKVGPKPIPRLDVTEDPKGNWVKFSDLMDDLKGLADVMIEFGNEALELIEEEEDDNSN